MRHVDNYISFEITRPLPSRLVLTLDESVDSDPSLIQIFIGNGYESEVISIMENLSFWLPMVSSRFGASLWISEDGFFYIVQ